MIGQPPSPEELWDARRRGWPVPGAVATLVALAAAASVILGLAPPKQAAPTGGLILDIIGVCLLARGALLSDEDIQSIGTYGDMGGKRRRESAIRLREEGRLGVVLAMLGFFAQLGAYLLP